MFRLLTTAASGPRRSKSSARTFAPQGLEDLPHVFDGDELCLCYPRQFNPRILIAKTIIPWASEWLLHFEFFLITGAWHGGGHEPAVAPR